MNNEQEKAEDYQTVTFDQRLRFRDRAPDDPLVGPARMVDTAGRCAHCWGPIKGTRETDDGAWIRIECRLCARAVHADDAEREAERMRREAEKNIPRARIGRSAVYHQKAQFVLKILPDMDRDKVAFGQRVATARRAKPKEQWLGRRDFREGTPGYLYAQASAFVSGLANLRREMSAISLSDFDFGEPRIIGVEATPDDGAFLVSAAAPVVHRKPSGAETMARMGTAMVAGMVAAFACEVGMKALLVTRQDAAQKTHDLLKLYESLPEDSRRRLEADFPEIADILKDNRHAFGKWRYFEDSTGGAALASLVHTERVWGLGKAARVILDECVVAGLQYDIDLRYQFNSRATVHVDDGLQVTVAPDDVRTTTKVAIEVTGHECAIPWDAILSSGQP